MRSRRWKGTAAICAATLLLAGCGSAEEEREKRSDDERATAALITREDLPADWSPLTDTGDETLPSKAELAKMCPGYPADWMIVEDPDADASFEMATATLTHGISIEADAARAREQFDDLDSERSRRCMAGIVGWSMRQGLAEEPDAGIEVGEVTAAPLELGDGQRGMRIDVPMSVGDAEVPAQADMVVAERDGVLSVLLVMGVGESVDEALRDRLADVARERLDEQFGG